ncbi:MAG: hypothetical protein K2K69_05650 [Muribaculaceae bacterium]|nr:hypothetical protein [Muribaculaceae bacterium]
MKKIFVFLLCVLAMCAGVKAQDAPQDSTVSVIAWFNKGDVREFVVRQAEHWFAKGDTVPLYSCGERFRIEVTDSTAQGYKMAFNIVESWVDSIPGSEVNDLMARVNSKMDSTVREAIILFETDECGAITSFTNLDDVRARAEEIYAKIKDDIVNQEEIDLLEENGVDISELLDESNIKKLVDGFVEEIQMLFQNHGKAFQLGQHTSHDEEDGGVVVDRLIDVKRADDTHQYRILSAMEMTVPQNIVREAVKEGVESITENQDLINAADAEFNHQVVFDTESRAVGVGCYYPDGWPYYYARIIKVNVGTQGKIIQTQIDIVD